MTMGLIHLLRPMLIRFAMAHPNPRSSHSVPTPQGAGLAVVGATLICSIAAMQLLAVGHSAAAPNIIAFGLAIVGLAAIGFVDDIAPLPLLSRLAVQTVACLGLLLALPVGARALPFVPYPLEALISLVGLVWFVNLTNFMDGIDGMSVAGILPILAGISLLAGWSDPAAAVDATIALALAGALIGFAPFNRHVAKVFLGDAGSLAIGGIAGWLLLSLSGRAQLIASLILGLYYLSDTTVTLLLRWFRGESLGQAHGEHFYQRGVARGLRVQQVVAHVWALNCALLLLALCAGSTARLWVQLACLAIGAALTAWMLRHFRGHSSKD